MYTPDELIFLAPERNLLAFSEGGFARRVWVIALAEPQVSSNNRDFITKVLAAANLNLEKDTLFAEIPASEPVNFSSDWHHKQPDHILVFGLPPAQLGLAIEAASYKPIAFYGATWLFADPLSMLEPDKNKKGLLWSALKQMFL
jgi:hypothetical protein